MGSREDGFTLIEVLAAIVILGLGLAALYQSFGTGMRNVDVAERHLGARQLAQSLLEEHTAGRLLRPGASNGRHGAYRWRIQVAPADERLAPPTQPGEWQLMAVAVIIDWPPARQLRLDTLRLAKVQ